MKNVNLTLNRSKRLTNIEYLRIICMLLIIMHHCIGHGGAAYMETCFNRIIGLMLLPGGKICFNTFLAISTWFMVDSTFKMERFIKIWLQVLFYSITFGMGAFLLGKPMIWRDWVSLFFPIAGNSHGFAASYLAFYLLTPFLKKITTNLTQKQIRVLVILLMYFEIGTQLIGNVTKYLQPIPSELLLFVMCYFIAYYLKKYPLKIQKSRGIMLIIFIICWLFVFCVQYMYLVRASTSSLIDYLWNIIKDESSIINIVGGYSLFFLFYYTNIPEVPSINKISKHTFGILLMHDNNFFRSVLWLQLLMTPTWYYSKYFIIYVILAALMIFLIGMIVDILREKIIEKNIFKINCLKKICIIGDRMINGENDV